MAENSKIEWTDHTFNPWIGCTKVSAACDHCYAETATPTRTMRAAGRETWGPHAPRQRTSAANWNKPRQWNRKAEAEGRRYRVFCASLADVFDNHHTIERAWRDDLMNLIERTPNLDWLLLTKRPQNVARFVPEWMNAKEWPSNVWLGTTVENQTEAERRIPHLLATPAAVRFLSVEPMLGPVDLTRIRVGMWTANAFTGLCVQGAPVTEANISWVICGGESGPGARPMHPDWARSLRDQCNAAGVPFFFKQWGEFRPPETDSERQAVRAGEGMGASLMLDGTFGNPRGNAVLKVGKKAAGRKLDGREWNEMPGVSHE